MDTTYGYAPTEKMLEPTTLAEMLRISDRHLTYVRKDDKTCSSRQTAWARLPA